MPKLSKVRIRGYRSIKDATLELRPLNVLIGANGAGKSNLVSFFKLMNELMAGRLQQFVASTGHATSNLYFGPGVTPQLEAELEFETDTGAVDIYRMRLGHAARDSLIFTEECLSYRLPGYTSGREEQLGPGPPGNPDRQYRGWNWRHGERRASVSVLAQRTGRFWLPTHTGGTGFIEAAFESSMRYRRTSHVF